MSLRRAFDRSGSSFETGTVQPAPILDRVLRSVYPPILDRSHYSSLATTAAPPPSLYRSRSGPRPNLQNSQPRRSVKRVCNKATSFMDLERRARTCTYDTKIRWLISAWSNASNLKTVTNIAARDASGNQM